MFEQRLEENESELVKRSKDGAFQTEGPASENSDEVGLCFVWLRNSRMSVFLELSEQRAKWWKRERERRNRIIMGLVNY